jgi:hypothetical protein
MVLSNAFGFLSILRQLYFMVIALFFVLFLCPPVMASMEALVVVEKAIIFADSDMTSPIGFIPKGKKVTIGEVARNKAQVYPIIVSKKVAYIRAVDLSTEQDSVDSKRLTAERFQQNVKSLNFGTRFSFDYLKFSSTISTNGVETDKYKNNDTVSWNGVALRGDLLFKNRFDLEVIFNYLNCIKADEEINNFELGLGAGLRIIDSQRVLFKLKAEVLGVPFASFNIERSRINGWGHTLGGGANLGIIMGESWGLDIFGGFFYTKLRGLDLPSNNKEFSPSFSGLRLGAGLTFKL